MPTGGNLPAEIIQEILLRLPTKSLGQFKCVSKSWRALISDPKFAKTHLTLNKRRRPKLLLSDLHFFDDVNIDGKPYVSSSKIDFKQTHKWIGVYSSCNGLILAQAKNYQLFLLNPATQECKKLPDLMEVDFDGNIACGFGYDSTSDDYKVVISNFGVLYVYSLRSDAWKIVEVSLTDNNAVILDHHRPGIYLNDSIHWLFYYLPSSVSIIAFDLADEKLKIVPQPHEFHPLAYQEPFLSLYEVGGCLCSWNDFDETDVWVMKDGVESSWTKFGRVITWDVDWTPPIFGATDLIYPAFFLPDKELILMYMMRPMRSRYILAM